MGDRDRLINLIINAKHEDPETGSFTEFLADYLITNGVILSPVDIGKTVYKISLSGKIVSLNVANYDYGVITFPYNIIPFENFGKTVFLTREEAEKALERSKGNETNIV